MIRLTLAAALTLGTLATPSFAASKKETDCDHQAAVVAAVQAARIARVSERKVKETILAEEVSWPERYNNAIPIFAGQIYQLKMRDVKANDLSVEWKATCMAG